MTGAIHARLQRWNKRRRLYRRMRRLIREAGRGRGASIVLTGLPRIGKSVVAQRFCARHGYVHVPLDSALTYLKLLDDDDARYRARLRLVDWLLRRGPKGLCIEGSDLHAGFPRYRELVARRSAGEAGAGCNLSLPEGALRDLANRVGGRGAALFVAGCCDSPEAKGRALHEYRATGQCHTSNKFDDAQTDHLADIIVALSRDYARECAATGVPFLDISSVDFDDAIDLSVARITGALRAGVADNSAAWAARPRRAAP